MDADRLQLGDDLGVERDAVGEIARTRLPAAFAGKFDFGLGFGRPEIDEHIFNPFGESIRRAKGGDIEGETLKVR